MIFNLNDYKDGTQFNLQFKYIRAYHACRPLSTKKYLENGIIPYTRERAFEDAMLRFGEIDIQIREKFNLLWSNSTITDEKVYLTISKKELIVDSGHYLIYGSELLSALALEIHCLEYLRKFGIPTIFICNIPVEDIPESSLEDIKKSIYNGTIRDVSISVSRILPQNIIDYEHPKRIRDPLNQGRYYYPNYRALTKKYH